VSGSGDGNRTHLSLCDLAADRTAAAEDILRQALEIFQQIGAVDVTDVPANWTP